MSCTFFLLDVGSRLIRFNYLEQCCNIERYLDKLKLTKIGS